MLLRPLERREFGRTLPPFGLSTMVRSAAYAEWVHFAEGTHMHTALSVSPGRSRASTALRAIALLVGVLTLCFGAVLANAQPALAVGEKITGTLSGWKNETTDYTKVSVGIRNANGSGGESWTGGDIDANGKFTITGFAPGTYYLDAMVWNGTGSPDNALQSAQILDLGAVDTITVNAGQTVTKNATMLKASAKISGKITVQDKDRAQVIVDQKIGDRWVTVGSAWSGPGLAPVNYATFGLVPGTYRAVFLAFDNGESPEQIWWDDVFGEQLAKPISLAADQNRTGINALFRTDFDTRPTGVSVTGTPRVGSKISAKLNGAWSPNPDAIEYRWSPVGSGGPGGPAQVTGATYTPTASDAGGTVLLQVTATRSDRKMDFVETTVKIQPGVLTAPVPTVSGSAVAGEPLTANAGAWGPGQVALKYQWLRNGDAVSGATSASFTPAAADAGAQVSVRVTGSQAGYTTQSKTSAAVTVKPGMPYTDVPAGHAFYKPIKWMYVNGYAAPAPKFYPGNAMTRGAMATMLQRINDSDYQPSASLKLPYSDVQKTDTHYKGIAWMYENGYAAKASKYHAGNAVTRGAMATFMQRMKAPTYQPSGNLPYTDVKKTDTHYKGIAWMTENGYVAPASKYRADAPLTRGAMSAFLNRIFA
ncbi:hypothetical protein D3248_12760 [Leucobacter zeae]|nr:hypothetical protein [Leucobacter zeae]